MNQKISSIISSVRFPLAVMVVYVHFFGEGNVIVSEIDWRSFSWTYFYDAIRVHNPEQTRSLSDGEFSRKIG